MIDTQTSHLYEIKMPIKYDSTKDEFVAQDRYIQGLTHADVSQFITNFPFIYQIYKKNKSNEQWKLLDQLMKVPSETDCPGFIYGFMNENENNILQAPYWIKIGRTKQNPPQKRIFQWERDENLELTQIFTVRSLYNKKLETLIHTLFSYAREKRWLNGKQRIQWFKFQEITLTAAAVNILNHIMNTIHTSHMLKNPKVYLNRSLKQLTEKLMASNNQLKDIAKTSPDLLSQSLARDLGIQIGKDNQIKIQLANCNSLQEMLPIIKDYGLGKQLKECCIQIQQTHNTISKYTKLLEQFQKKAVSNIKQIYEKTQVHLVKFDDTNHKTMADNKKEENKETEKKTQRYTSRKQITQKKTENQKNSKTQKIKIRKGFKQTENPKENKQNQNQCAQIKIQQAQKHEKISKQQDNNEIIEEICKKIQNLDIHKNNNESNIHYKADKENDSLITIIYDSMGNQKQIQITSLKKEDLKKNNNTLRNYKRGKNQQEIRSNCQTKEQQNEEQVFVDINAFEFEEKIDDHDATYINDDIYIQQMSRKVIQAQKMSDFKATIAQNHSGQDFFIFNNKFTIDVKEIKLQSNYMIMAKDFILTNALKITKGKESKGFLRIFCDNFIDHNNILDIDKDCMKYVEIFKVIDEKQIMPIDQYHSKRVQINKQVKNLAYKYLQLFQIHI